LQEKVLAEKILEDKLIAYEFYIYLNIYLIDYALLRT
jgi:hypothetical protein